MEVGSCQIQEGDTGNVTNVFPVASSVRYLVQDTQADANCIEALRRCSDDIEAM